MPRDLVGVAGALGGPRPKANVEGDGHLWIAKFSSAQDTRPVERVEVATLKLAAQCGLRVAEAILELRDSDSLIALIRRLDRRSGTRAVQFAALCSNSLHVAGTSKSLIELKIKGKLE